MSGVDRAVRRAGLAALLLALAPASHADTATDQRWLAAIGQAGRDQDYAGVFVVQTQQQMQSWRIEHRVEHGQVQQRVQSRDGHRRVELGRGDRSWVLLPGPRQVLDLRGMPVPKSFPGLLAGLQPSLLRSYSLRRLPPQRCLEQRRCDVSELVPRDGLRFGYRLWTDASSHLILKLQILDASGAALQQLAFTAIGPAPADDPVAAALAASRDWQQLSVHAQATTPPQQGWALERPPPGFVAGPMVERTLAGADHRPHRALQWLFSDGLASVSLFIGRDLPAPGAASRIRFGPTHALQQQRDGWQVVALGNVPDATLSRLLDGLHRVPVPTVPGAQNR